MKKEGVLRKMKNERDSFVNWSDNGVNNCSPNPSAVYTVYYIHRYLIFALEHRISLVVLFPSEYLTVAAKNCNFS